ncbi:MAG: VanZ family protein [Bacteroidota bacterium]
MSVPRFIPAIGWFIFSLVLLCLPGSRVPSYPWLATIHADKLIHITLFGILCLLFARPFHKSSQSVEQRKKWFFLILLGGVAYGTAMEFVQKYWVSNRSFEAWDIAADSVGCLLAYFYSLKKWLEKKPLS